MDEKKPKRLKILPRHLTLTATPMGVFRWRCNPPAQLSFDDLLDPETWDSVSDKFQVREEKHQGQVVEILTETHEWYAEIIIFRLRNGNLAIKKLSYHPFDTLEKESMISADNFNVDFRGKKKWSIVRKADGKVIDELIDSKEKAYEMLDKYIADVA